MKAKLKLSVAKPLPERVELVQLEAIGADGWPLVVQCQAIPALVSVKIVKRFPGAVVKLGPKVDDAAALDHAEDMIELFKAMILHGAALARPGGGFVKPAFWFDEHDERDPLSLDGRYLPIMDITNMGLSVMKLSGYGGEAATKSFRGSR